jgi:hypothetical protein
MIDLVLTHEILDANKQWILRKYLELKTITAMAVIYQPSGQYTVKVDANPID